MEVLPAGGGAGQPGARDAGERQEQREPGGRASRTVSLVSGLLTELYSCAEEDEAAGRGPGDTQRHRDSLDSSTEASGPDALLGGRPATGLSQRLQVQHLRQKDSDELKMILQELKYRIGIQSAKLLRQLKQKDRLLHNMQTNCDIVTACLQAVSQKRKANHFAIS